MTRPRQVLLVVDEGAPEGAPVGLLDALSSAGADVRSMSLVPPYDDLLDALADGWLPVYVGGTAASAPMP